MTGYDGVGDRTQMCEPVAMKRCSVLPTVPHVADYMLSIAPNVTNLFGKLLVFKSDANDT